MDEAAIARLVTYIKENWIGPRYLGYRQLRRYLWEALGRKGEVGKLRRLR